MINGLKSRRWLWALAGLVLAGLALWLLLAGQPGDEAGPGSSETPAEGPGQPGSLGPVAGQPGIEITADSPARIAAVGEETLDLGSTPTRLNLDQAGYWEITAYDPASQKQQRVSQTWAAAPGQKLPFQFAGSRRWSNPLEARAGAVNWPLVSDGSLAGLNQGQLLEVGLDQSPGSRALVDGSELIRKLVWHDRQNYLYLTAAGRLVMVRPGAGWTVDDVVDLAGGGGQAGWLTAGDEVWLFDWDSNQRTRTGISGAGADGLFLGRQLVYLFSWGTRTHQEDFHPVGQLSVRDRAGNLVGRVEIPARPEAMAELQGRSFWQIAGELYIVDGRTGELDQTRGFGHPIADLTAGVDHQGRAAIYLLTETGEVWDFDANRQTYNLVGRAPRQTGISGAGIANSLVQDGETIYFGFRWLGATPWDQTYRLDLAGP